MYGFGLLEDVKIIKTFDEVTAATSAANGVTIDTAGAEGVIFVTVFGTQAVDNGVKVQQDTASGMGTAADLLGSLQLVDATKTTAVNQVHRPRERYVRAVAVRGTSTTIPAGFAIVYGLKSVPFANGSQADVAAKVLVSPAEGTA
jgi:hypothetical protein